MKNQTTILMLAAGGLAIIAAGAYWYSVQDQSQDQSIETPLANTPNVPPSSSSTSPHHAQKGEQSSAKKVMPQMMRTTSEKSGPALSFMVVSYTNRGFSPALAEVRLGQAVRFQNNSSRALWVQTTNGIDPATNSGFNEGVSIKPGEHWDFVFAVQGTWSYENLDYPQDKGAVAVEPQNY